MDCYSDMFTHEVSVGMLDTVRWSFNSHRKLKIITISTEVKGTEVQKVS